MIRGRLGIVGFRQDRGKNDAPEQPGECGERAEAEQGGDRVAGEVGIFPREIGIIMPGMRVREVRNDRQQADGSEGAQD